VENTIIKRSDSSVVLAGRFRISADERVGGVTVGELPSGFLLRSRSGPFAAEASDDGNEDWDDAAAGRKAGAGR